ncbi:MAG: PpiC-type peptidyl-prolyl cis-trans isomerase [Gemmatimonadetes bacterium]|nr:PpiC-type peptidyl-prolyl cis-trans isomerase [Gemmatimonadota bacterium]
MRGLAKYIWVLVAFVFVGGFLLYETSGLMGRTPVTTTTPVAVVNGHDILYSQFQARVQNEVQSEQQRSGQTLSQDDTRRIENSVFDQMVSDVLLQDEYRRRGIVVTDDEVREFARYAPPSWITGAPELQTEGRFDPDKYARLLASPQARQGGLLVSLENYYRTEIPREKLFDQIGSGVYVSDSELWRAWRDQHDSAQVSYVSFVPTPDPAAAKAISDADLHAYFDQHKSEFQGPGRAVLSVVTIPRTVTAADSAAARAKVVALREEIVKGAKFEDVAKRESADTVSGRNGGDLGKGGKGRFVPDFEKAAYALGKGELSQPVLTPFGYHLIKVDEKKGDTLSLRHILVRIQASDSSTTRIDKEADVLSRSAGSSDQGKKLDTAAQKLGLKISRAQAFEGQPATMDGKPIPSASAWAFGGAKPGETSELFDDENGYYLVRLDSLHEGGEPKFENVKEEIRGRVAASRQLDKLLPDAQKLASAAATSTLEAAAQQAGKKVEQTPMFSRSSIVPGLGQFNEAVGAAFALPTGAVSAPVKTNDGVYVLRVDKRVLADSAAWVAQKPAQKATRLQQLRQQKIQMFLQDMRKAAKVDDRRKKINAATRRADV